LCSLRPTGPELVQLSQPETVSALDQHDRGIGTSMPTSTTDVETRISISPWRNRVMVSSFSLAFILPCSNPSRLALKMVCCSRSYSSVAALASTFSVSSMSG